MFEYEKARKKARQIAIEALAWSKTATKEERLAKFVRAGILDENGRFTEPYAILEGHVKFNVHD